MQAYKLPTADLGHMRIASFRVDIEPAVYGTHVRIRSDMMVTDVEPPHNTIPTCHVQDIPSFDHLPPNVVRSIIKRHLMKHLEHELDEWLRIDGELVTEPHPDAF